MIAIPVDSASMDVKSSKLFGNVKMFALFDPAHEGEFSFIENEESGNGIQTAAFLAKKGIKRVVYSFMGNGPFNELASSGVDVFYIGKEPLELGEIAKGLKEGGFIKVDKQNAASYLDPGTRSQHCECT